MRELVFLKLGGSLITDKTRPYSVRQDILAGLAKEIFLALQAAPGLRLVLGHGSGSFGHTAAEEYRTKDGLPASPGLMGNSLELREKAEQPEDDRYWRGFAEVWYQASTLNRYVLQALHEAGLSAITFSPAASVWAENGRVLEWDVSRIKGALEKQILPVVHGDVIFDQVKGGTILSTEDLFEHLAFELRPRRILLAGLETGVWADFPVREQKIGRLTSRTFDEVSQSVGNAVGADVTGGMASKVRQMLDLVDQIPDLSVQVFSGVPVGNLRRALQGEILGTLIESG